MRNWKKTAIICGMILIPSFLHAQEGKKSSRIGVEFGGNVFFGETIVPEQIRESTSLYEYDDFYCGFPSPEQELDNFYGGIKYETFFWNDRLGFSTGLRFSQLSSELNANWRYNYFLYRFRQNETSADYLAIQKIRQNNYYIGIPLECRVLLKKRTYSFFNPYFKLGTSINYLVSTNNSITFNDPAMIRYNREVSEQINKPKSFYAWIYPVFGFRLGKMENVWFNMEVNFPGFLIEDKVHPFTRTDVGMGLQLSLQIPLIN